MGNFIDLDVRNTKRAKKKKKNSEDYRDFDSKQRITTMSRCDKIALYITESINQKQQPWKQDTRWDADSLDSVAAAAVCAEGCRECNIWTRVFSSLMQGEWPESGRDVRN